MLLSSHRSLFPHDQLLTAIRESNITTVQLLTPRFWHPSHIPVFVALLDNVRKNVTLQHPHGLPSDRVQKALQADQIKLVSDLVKRGGQLASLNTLPGMSSKQKIVINAMDDEGRIDFIVLLFNVAAGRVVLDALALASPSAASRRHQEDSPAQSQSRSQGEGSPVAAPSPLHTPLGRSQGEGTGRAAASASSASNRRSTPSSVARWLAEPRAVYHEPPRPQPAKQTISKKRPHQSMASAAAAADIDHGQQRSRSVCSQQLSPIQSRRLREAASTHTAERDRVLPFLSSGAQHSTDVAATLLAMERAVTRSQAYIEKLEAAAAEFGAGYRFGVSSELAANHPGTARLVPLQLVSAPLAAEKHPCSLLQAVLQQVHVWSTDLTYPDHFRVHLEAHPELLPHLLSVTALRTHVIAVMLRDCSETDRRIVANLGNTPVWDERHMKAVGPSLSTLLNVRIRLVQTEEVYRDGDAVFNPKSSVGKDARYADFVLLNVPSQWYGTLRQAEASPDVPEKQE